MERTLAMIEELGVRMPMLVAPEGSNPLMRDYQIAAWPCYCLIDEQGVVHDTGFPVLYWPAWQALVEAWGVPAPDAPPVARALEGAVHE